MKYKRKKKNKYSNMSKYSRCNISCFNRANRLANFYFTPGDAPSIAQQMLENGIDGEIILNQFTSLADIDAANAITNGTEAVKSFISNVPNLMPDVDVARDVAAPLGAATGLGIASVRGLLKKRKQAQNLLENANNLKNEGIQALDKVDNVTDKLSKAGIAGGVGLGALGTGIGAKAIIDRNKE